MIHKLPLHQGWLAAVRSHPTVYIITSWLCCCWCQTVLPVDQSCKSQSMVLGQLYSLSQISSCASSIKVCMLLVPVSISRPLIFVFAICIEQMRFVSAAASDFLSLAAGRPLISPLNFSLIYYWHCMVPLMRSSCLSFLLATLTPLEMIVNIDQQHLLSSFAASRQTVFFFLSP